MTGFGYGPFGHGPFGHDDWSRRTLWDEIPESDRRRDADEAGGRMEKFIESIRPSFDFLRQKADDFLDLRDPDRVRTQFNGQIPVTLLDATVDVSAVSMTVQIDQPTPGDPFDPLGDTSVGWILTDSSGREYLVNSVDKVGGTIEVVGAELPVTEASSPGNGGATLAPPSLIANLGSDSGVEIDFHEPEAYQRSSVRDALQWMDRKGSVRGYEILGLISGFSVVPIGLWRIETVPAGIPPSRVYEIPAGSGNMYTDFEPSFPLMDEIAMDAVPLDMYCWETALWQTDSVEPPDTSVGVPDNTSVGDAIGWEFQNITITSKTSVGANYWRVRLPVDLSKIVAPGHWKAQFSGMTDSVFIETTPVEVSLGVWEFDVLTGSSPAGTTVTLFYECGVFIQCGYCKASTIRVELTPTAILAETDAVLDGMIGRMARKVRQLIPVHVRETSFAYVVSPPIVSLDLSGTVEVEVV